MIGGWPGIVYCEWENHGESREDALACWGECGLRAGPFVFFGDPEMLAHIRGIFAVHP